jgi:hypothetical protein
VHFIDKILRREEFKSRPPVLVDVGASGEIHKEWRPIARHSVCVAFEADDRELPNVRRRRSGFRELHLVQAIVTDKRDDKAQFYLTKSPFCSSLLEPDAESLREWAFAELFEVERRIELPSVRLGDVLGRLGHSDVDWFKTDSQGIDLRLFEGLGEKIVNRVLVADFEPGIMDAYKGEDKLFSIMVFMNDHRFWMSDMRVCGSQRLSSEVLKHELGRFHARFLPYILKTSPGWAEVSFMNEMRNPNLFTMRDFLLGWVFAVVKRQYGFAYEIASRGWDQSGERVFVEMKHRALARLNTAAFRIPVRYLEKMIMKISSVLQ